MHTCTCLGVCIRGCTRVRVSTLSVTGAVHPRTELNRALVTSGPREVTRCSDHPAHRYQGGHQLGLVGAGTPSAPPDRRPPQPQSHRDSPSSCAPAVPQPAGRPPPPPARNPGAPPAPTSRKPPWGRGVHGEVLRLWLEPFHPQGGDQAEAPSPRGPQAGAHSSGRSGAPVPIVHEGNRPGRPRQRPRCGP